MEFETTLAHCQHYVPWQYLILLTLLFITEYRTVYIATKDSFVTHSLYPQKALFSVYVFVNLLTNCILYAVLFKWYNINKNKKIQMVVATDTSELIHSYNLCQWQRIEGMNKLYQRLLHLVSKQNFQLSINKLHTYWYELRLSFFFISAYIERVAINVQSFIFTRAIFVDYEFFCVFARMLFQFQ